MPPGGTWQCLETGLVVTLGGVVLPASRRRQSGMSLSSLQGTGRSRTKTSPGPKVDSSATPEGPSWECSRPGVASASFCPLWSSAAPRGSDPRHQAGGEQAVPSRAQGQGDETDDGRWKGNPDGKGASSRVAHKGGTHPTARSASAPASPCHSVLTLL